MKNKKGLVLILLGLLLAAAALLLSAYNLLSDWRASRAVSRAASQLEALLPPFERPEGGPSSAAGEEMPDYLLNPEVEMPVEVVDGQAYIGLLTIPACDLELPVLSEWSYPGLQLAPCRYSGSAYAGAFVIAGHNYQSHFGRLTNLLPGDVLTFTDVDGNRFFYRVEATEVLKSTDVEEMESDAWDLTLFTCNFDGQKRIAVRCLQTEGE